MIRLGLTLRCSVPPRRIWVVISDANTTGGEILMFNFTRLHPNTFDRSCILDTNDYGELTRPSAIATRGFPNRLFKKLLPRRVFLRSCHLQRSACFRLPKDATSQTSFLPRSSFAIAFSHRFRAEQRSNHADRPTEYRSKLHAHPGT
jgi:hypothetical protein